MRTPATPVPPASPPSAAVPARARAIDPRRLLVDYAIVWVVVALFVFLALTTPNFLTQNNLRNILDQQSLVLIAASVATLTMIAGGFDVSQGAVYVAAPLVALQVENLTGSVPLAAAAGLGFGLAVGVLNGAIVTGRASTPSSPRSPPRSSSSASATS